MSDTTVCKHGQLARQCEICELERENARLLEKADEADTDKLRAIGLYDSCKSEGDAMTAVLNLCMEQFPECRAYGDLPGWIAERNSENARLIDVIAGQLLSRAITKTCSDPAAQQAGRSSVKHPDDTSKFDLQAFGTPASPADTAALLNLPELTTGFWLTVCELQNHDTGKSWALLQVGREKSIEIKFWSPL